MDFMNTHDSWCYNNIFINNTIKLLSKPDYKLNSERNVVCNNTFIAPNKSSVILLLGAGSDYEYAKDCVVFNNICVTTNGASAIGNDGINNGVESNFTATYSTSLMDQIFDSDPSNGWRVDNFQLKSTTPITIRNAGRRYSTFQVDPPDLAPFYPEAPATDIMGVSRVEPYDIGAYEFVDGTPTYTLTIQSTTGGSVTKNPNKTSYAQNEQVILTAVANSGWSFTSWSGGLTGSVNPRTLTMTSNLTVGAVFTEDAPAPPLPPTAFQGSEVTPGCADLTWHASSSAGVSGYRIYHGSRSVQAGDASSYTDSVTVGNVTLAQICGLTAGVRYFNIRARNTSGDYSAYSGEIMVTLDGPDLEAPSIVVGSPADGAVDVDPRNTTIFFLASDGGAGVDTAEVSVLINGSAPAKTRYTGDPAAYAVVCEPAGPLPANSTIVVNVTVEDRASPSNTSTIQWSFATRSVPPTIPTGLSAYGGNDGCASLAWNPNPEPDVAAYTIYYGTASVASGDAAQYDDSMTVGDVTTRNICGLTNDTYYFAIRARNESGLFSPYSAEASAEVTDVSLQGPTPPQQVQVDENTPGCVTVAWDRNPESNIGGYVIYYGTQSVAQGESGQYPDSINVGNTTSREICGFSPGIEYFAVRAYSTTSLYSAYSAEKPVDVVGPDVVPPSLLIASPADGATGVSQTADILFVLSDVQSGVDSSSVAVTVGGRYPSSITYIGDPQRYAVVCRLGAALPPNTAITVLVRVSDLASPANETSKSWMFRTASSRPSAPTGLSAAGNSSGCADLAWDPNPESDLAGYVVYFGTVSVEGGQASTYSDSMVVGLSTNLSVCGLLEDTYYFAVRAKNVVGVLGGLSDEASAVVTNAATEGPLPPQQVHVGETSPGCVTIGWQRNTAANVAGYIVYHRLFSSLTGGPGEYTDSVDVGLFTSKVICNLEQGMYYFGVRTYDTSHVLGGFSTEKWIDVVGRDVSPPKVLVGGPVNDAIEVRPTSNVFFVVSDGQTGVDTASVYVSISGKEPSKVSYTGDDAAFAVVCDPGNDLPLNTRVTVQVTVADMASPPNLTRVTWSFRTTTGRPSPPAGLTAQGDDMGCINVAWNANPEVDVTGYRIYYGRESVALGDASSYDDSLTVAGITGRTVCGLPEGVYYVALRARNESGLLSRPSVEVSTQVSNGAAQPPLPPQNVQTVEGYPGCIKVSWQRNTEPNVAGYVVYHGDRSVANGDASAYDGSVDVGNKSSHQICGFDNGAYFVAVRAYDGTGAFSGFSLEQSVYVLGEDLEDPEIIIASPRDGATDVALNSSILFVVADGQTGVDRNSIEVKINGSAPGAMSVNGDSTSYAVVCERAGGFAANSSMTIEVAVSDLADTPNSKTISWSFTTGSVEDDAPPVLVAQDPAPGATNVDPSAVVRLRFSDASGISTPSIDFSVNGETVTDTSLTFHDNGDVTVQFDNETRFVPGSTVNVSVTLSDLASNSTIVEFSFEVREADRVPENLLARIVPDGYWAHDTRKPLEVRDLPPGWTVRIFDTGGSEVRSFRNAQTDGLDWTWNFENDHGRRVAKSLYLIRVVDESGSVKRSGRFVVRSDS